MPNSKVPLFRQKHMTTVIFLESTDKIMKTYQKIFGQKNITDQMTRGQKLYGHTNTIFWKH